LKIFAFSLREYDEQIFFKEICEEQGLEYGFTSDYPDIENAELAKGYEGVSIITNPMTPELLDRFRELGVKYISTRSIGYDHIDLPYAKKTGIRIAHVTYSPEGVADYTIMMMLMGCRKIIPILHRAKIQDYSLKGKMGRQLSSCTVGIIGTGRIGTTVAHFLSGFGCRLLAYDQYPSEAVKVYAEYTDLETIYRQADIITLHVPGSKDNYHMVDRAAFAQMKEGVMIVNAARGTLIDTADMIQALENGKIGFAALDTIENEDGLYYLNREGDILNNHERAILSSYPNVLLSPHTAFYTGEAVREMVQNSIQGLLNFEKQEPNPFEV